MPIPSDEFWADEHETFVFDANQFELDMLTFINLNDYAKKFSYEDAVKAAREEMAKNRKLEKEWNKGGRLWT
jgi:hypothetical protein